MHVFGPATRKWFEGTFSGPTAVQREGFRVIEAGEHALLTAPTGSGKTLAAFLFSLDRLGSLPEDAAPGIRVLYVSPLKALVYDIERNLRAPLAGIEAAAEELGVAYRPPRIDVRTGDTSPRDRRRQAKHPGEILVTTPESLYLILGSKAREVLRTVEHVIVDEVHALAPTKRGAHLALSLERLSAWAHTDPQRIGLSATARPTNEVASFLGGDRPVTIVDTSEPPHIDIEVVVPVDDMTRPEAGTPSPAEGEAKVQRGMWPVIYPELMRLIRAHRTTIIFVNSRGLAERLSQRLNELAQNDEDAEGIAMPFVLGHHGSLAHGKRREIEEHLKTGRVRAIVATSSLELGIDMGTVDLVVMVESPGAVARGLQRAGRAGHGVGEVSIGRIFPKHRSDLLEAAVVTRLMLEGDIEPLSVPENPLDVLAQQIVAMTSVTSWRRADLRRVIQRTHNFRRVPESAFVGVLDMLSGRYPSTDFADLRPRVLWDRESDVLTARRGSKAISLVNGGTIPDRGLYAVHLGPDGPRIGELDEEMVHETTAGQTFMLGASTWRVEEITRDRVVVSPAPGEPGKLPFWHGEGPGRPIELGRAIGAFVRESMALPRDEALSRLKEQHRLGPLAAKNLLAYLDEQYEATGTLPTDRRITIERFRDELGDTRVCILTPFGARVHAPWALSIEARLGKGAGFSVQTMWSDDGIVLTLSGGEESGTTSVLEALIPHPDEVEELLYQQLGESSLFASQFRENAARALLLPRRKPGARTPLWAQRLRSAKLLAVAKSYPAFPIVMETYRSCLKDVFDVPALTSVLQGIEERSIRVDQVETRCASPFARSLVFAYVATYLYEGDAPLAERRAQALSLDREMLRELLGQEELRELLDAEVIGRLEEELGLLTDERRARNVDAVHDTLRSLGDLSVAEVAARTDGEAVPWLRALHQARRAIPVHIGDEERWIAVEDAALYRDALGVELPPGLPEAFLEPPAEPMEQLLRRWAHKHGPFRTHDLSRRYRIPEGQVDALLRSLEVREELIRGDFRPGGHDPEWCDPEVLRRIKRRTLAKLRNEVAPIPPAALARFLPQWHGIGEASIGDGRLEEALVQLEGLPLSFRELEEVILPARVRGFQPRMLDDLGAEGWLTFIGRGSLGPEDGRVAFYRRSEVARLAERPTDPDELQDLEESHRRILEHLRTRGASFFNELEVAAAAPTTRDALEALWDLVWAGLVTNDTFAALRTLSARRTKRPSRGRRASLRPAGGRWSLVEGLLVDAPTETERAHARAMSLLGRHGIVSREVTALEGTPGGFRTTYQIFRALEEAGKVRRGYFVEGLGGAQFALPGAVDRLRRARDTGVDAKVTVLSAVDPANPYGWLLPWPAPTENPDHKPRRVAGATVVLVDGTPVLYLNRSGQKLRTFANHEDGLGRAVHALREVARRRRGKLLRIEEVDGAPARTSPHAARFREQGFTADHRGLILEAG